MKKIIFGAFIAFVFSVSAIASVVAFGASDEPLFAIVAVLFAAMVIGGVGYAIEDTKLGDLISGMFGKEECDE